MKPWEKYSSTGGKPWEKYGASNKSIQPSENSNIPSGAILPTIKTAAKELYSTPISELGKGFVEGASFGAKQFERPLEGSVFENPLASTFRGAGRAAGTIVPVIASEGVSAPLVAARGGGAIAQGAATGLTFGAAKAAAQGLPPQEGLKEAAKSSAVFGGFGAAGNAVGYIRKTLGEDVAEAMQTAFLNVDKKIGMKLRQQGQPSLSKQALKEPSLGGFKTRNEVYNKAGEELFKLENRIGGQLGKELDRLKTPNIPEVKISGTPQLEYKPSSIQSGIQNPNAFIPQNIINNQISKKYTILPDGRRVDINTGGDIVALPSKFETPYLGSEIRTPIIREGAEITGFQTNPVLFKKGGNVGVFQPSTKTELARESEQARELARFAANKYGLKNLKEESFSIPRDGIINRNELMASFDDIAEGLKTGTRKKEIAEVERLRRDFASENPEKLNLVQAMGLKRKLDDSVANAYTKLQGQSIPNKIEIEEALANKLRKRIYEINPTIGELARKESLMIRVRAGLLPKVSTYANNFHGVYNFLADLFTGFPGVNVVSRSLNKNLSVKNPISSSLLKQSSRAIVNLPKTDRNK